MHKLSKYIISLFSGYFFSIFMPIIAIGSLVLFVRIAKLTEIAHMTASEMLLMYSYSLPTILFYTLPIIFFTSLIITLNRLSNDYETIVLFSFGISPLRIIRIFLPSVLLLCITLMVLSIVLIPITKQLTKSFINYKRVNIALNIKASKFGQKFDDWMLFLESRTKDKTMHNIVLYNASNLKEEQFLIAKEGKFFNENGTIGLMLNDGQAYKIVEDKIDQINYKTLVLYHNANIKPFSYQNIPQYWKAAIDNSKRLKDLIIYISVSLFPLVTLFWAFAFGILHHRYDKNYSYIMLLIVISTYYGAVSYLAKTAPVSTFGFILFFTTLGGIIFYAKVQRRF